MRIFTENLAFLLRYVKKNNISLVYYLSVFFL
jgi:hypothetical protein